MFALMGHCGCFRPNAADSVSAGKQGRVTMTRMCILGAGGWRPLHGLTKLTFDRMVPPYGLEVTYDKTTHIIFPSAVRYVDLGSPNLVAGKGRRCGEFIRVKAVVRNFRDETNMSGSSPKAAVSTRSMSSMRKNRCC